MAARFFESTILLERSGRRFQKAPEHGNGGTGVVDGKKAGELVKGITITEPQGAAQE
jgi:hypothetical protein